MALDLLSTLEEMRLETIYYVLSIGILRPLGLTFGFMAFVWAMGFAVTLRIAISVALALPLMIANLDDSIWLAENATRIELAMLSPREFAIGFGLGILSSLPFLALQYAGAITDDFRGEGGSGLQDPAGGDIQTYSVLYVIVGLFVFFSLGGLWQITAGLYKSYEIWPLNATLPALSPESGMIALKLLDDTLMTAAVIAAPLLILMMAIDLGLMFAAKLAQKLGAYDDSFLLRNTTAIFSLPVVAVIIIRVAESRTPDAVLGLSILQDMLK